MGTCTICERELFKLQRTYQQKMVELREDYLKAMQAIYEAHGAGEHEEESDAVSLQHS